MPSPTFDVATDALDDLTLDTILTSRLSIREISRQSGVPYTTLQNILSGETRVPTAASMARLDAWAAQGPIVTTRRFSTWVSDSQMWSDSKLANLQPPAGAQAFKLVGRSTNTPDGWGSTEYVFLRDISPLDYVRANNIDPRALGRVVWTRPGNLPRAP